MASDWEALTRLTRGESFVVERVRLRSGALEVLLGDGPEGGHAVEAHARVRARHRQISVAQLGVQSATRSYERNLERIREGQGSAEGYEILGDQLVIHTAEGDIHYTADREPLLGTLWSLISLGSVNDQQCSFAGSERSRDFIAKVDMARSVYQVQGISLAVVSLVR